MSTERRRYLRPEALNLLDYLVVDAQGRQGEYSMARTLNVSKGGILMETHIPLPKGQQVMITLGLCDQLIDVMGNIVYTAEDSGRFQHGIEFSTSPTTTNASSTATSPPSTSTTATRPAGGRTNPSTADPPLLQDWPSGFSRRRPYSSSKRTMSSSPR